MPMVQILDSKMQETLLEFFPSGSDQFVLQAGTQDKDIIFKGNDGGSVITALTLDMSDGGKAIFGSVAQFASDISIEAASGNPSLTIKKAEQEQPSY